MKITWRRLPLCAVAVHLFLSSNVFAQPEQPPTFQRLFKCKKLAEPGDGGLPDSGLPDAGTGRCHWDCTCGGWDLRYPAPKNLYQTCHEECEPEPRRCEGDEKPRPIGKDTSLQQMLRCFYIGSPSASGTGEAAAFIRRGEGGCEYQLADKVTSKDNHANQTCTGASDIVASVHTHPTWIIDPITHKVTQVSPEPSRVSDSRGDVASAMRCKIPFYVLTDRYVWVAYPNGTTKDVTSQFPGWADSKCGQ